MHKDLLIWLWRHFSHKSGAHFHPLQGGQWWHYLWNRMRCHKFLPVGISWWSSAQDTHFLTKTQIPLPATVRDGFTPCISRADKHDSSATRYQGVSTWLFDLWRIWVMNKFMGWKRQLRISHSRPDLQATHKSLSCSDIKIYAADKVTGLLGGSARQKTNWTLYLYLVSTNLAWQREASPALSCFFVRQFHLSGTGRICFLRAFFFFLQKQLPSQTGFTALQFQSASLSPSDSFLLCLNTAVHGAIMPSRDLTACMGSCGNQ